MVFSNVVPPGLPGLPNGYMWNSVSVEARNHASSTPEKKNSSIPFVDLTTPPELREAVQGKRFKILSHLEKKGLELQKAELEKRLEKEKSLEVEIELVKLKLFEIRGCYQGVKDQLQKEKSTLQQMQAQFAAKDHRISEVEKELQVAVGTKRKRDEEYQELAIDYQSKKSKFDETDTENEKLTARVKLLENTSQHHLATIAKLEEKIKDLQQKWLQDIKEQTKQFDSLNKQLQAERENSQKAQSKLEQVSVEYNKMARAKRATETQLAEEKAKNEALQKKVADLRKVIEEKDVEILDKRLNIQTQNKCFTDLEKVMDKRRNSVFLIDHFPPAS